jgi:hypothetical protein
MATRTIEQIDLALTAVETQLPKIIYEGQDITAPQGQQGKQPDAQPKK